jgi:hypothetical protein
MMPRSTDRIYFGRAAAVVAAMLVTAFASAARATPRPLPFTYQHETLPAGTAEIEQFVDFVPLRAVTSSGGTETVPYLGTQFTTEFEIGLTDRLELGLYVTYVPQPGEDFVAVPHLISGNGAKQRLRYRLADPGAWPIDVGLYFEVAENEREIELEAKIILQRRFGAVRLISNLWVEQEFYYTGGEPELILNPTLGVTGELSPRYHLGAEAWLRVEDFGESGEFNAGPHVFAGPTFLANFGRLWWSTGAYLRATDFSHDTSVGDQFGRFWVRTIIGISL